MNEVYERRKAEARTRGKCLHEFLEDPSVPKKSKKAIRKELEKMADDTGLIEEFRDSGYL